jgi:hypothetical protein
MSRASASAWRFAIVSPFVVCLIYSFVIAPILQPIILVAFSGNIMFGVFLWLLIPAYVVGVIPAALAGWAFFAWDKAAAEGWPRPLGAGVIGVVVSFLFYALLLFLALLVHGNVGNLGPLEWTGMALLSAAGGVAAAISSLIVPAERPPKQLS